MRMPKQNVFFDNSDSTNRQKPKVEIEKKKQKLAGDKTKRLRDGSDRVAETTELSTNHNIGSRGVDKQN